MKEQRWTIGAGGFIGEVTLRAITSANVVNKVKKERDLMFLTNLFVHPLRRGRGWAQALLQTATTYADRSGVDLWLYARPYGCTRTKAGRVHRLAEDELRRLYRRHGFRDIVGSGLHCEMVRRVRH